MSTLINNYLFFRVYTPLTLEENQVYSNCLTPGTSDLTSRLQTQIEHQANVTRPCPFSLFLTKSPVKIGFGAYSSVYRVNEHYVVKRCSFYTNHRVLLLHLKKQTSTGKYFTHSLTVSRFKGTWRELFVGYFLNYLYTPDTNYLLRASGFDISDVFTEVLYFHAFCTLGMYMRNYPQYPIKNLSPFLTSLIKGLNQFHVHGWIHGDIKPDNILLFDSSFTHTLRQPPEKTSLFVPSCSPKECTSGQFEFGVTVPVFHESIIDETTLRQFLHPQARPTKSFLTPFLADYSICCFNGFLMHTSPFVSKVKYLLQVREGLAIQTEYFRAPEVLLGCPYATTVCDIWSLGCVFFHLFLGKRLFVPLPIDYRLEIDRVSDQVKQQIILFHASDVDLFCSRVTGIFLSPSHDFCKPLLDHFQCWKQTASQEPIVRTWQDLFVARQIDAQRVMSLSYHALHLLDRMLDFDPVTRITTKELMEHPFFFSDKQEPFLSSGEYLIGFSKPKKAERWSLWVQQEKDQLNSLLSVMYQPLSFPEFCTSLREEALSLFSECLYDFAIVDDVNILTTCMVLFDRLLVRVPLLFHMHHDLLPRYVLCILNIACSYFDESCRVEQLKQQQRSSATTESKDTKEVLYYAFFTTCSEVKITEIEFIQCTQRILSLLQGNTWVQTPYSVFCLGVYSVLDLHPFNYQNIFSMFPVARLSKSFTQLDYIHKLMLFDPVLCWPTSKEFMYTILFTLWSFFFFQLDPCRSFILPILPLAVEVDPCILTRMVKASNEIIKRDEERLLLLTNEEQIDGLCDQKKTLEELKQSMESFLIHYQTKRATETEIIAKGKSCAEELESLQIQTTI